MLEILIQDSKIIVRVLAPRRPKAYILKLAAMKWQMSAGQMRIWGLELGTWDFLSKKNPQTVGIWILQFIRSVAYLKKESTNSTLLKTCRSSSPSPTPIYFTGI